MQALFLTLLLVAGVIGGVHWYAHDRRVRHAAGVLAPGEPAIVSASASPSWRDAHGFRYRALGRFGGRVVVVARTNYSVAIHSDASSALST
jgi:hypothetical protein